MLCFTLNTKAIRISFSRPPRQGFGCFGPEASFRDCAFLPIFVFLTAFDNAISLSFCYSFWLPRLH